jgi:peptidyl-dipeptidase Dcp
VLARLDNRELRERVFRASMDRGRGGPHDTTAIAVRIAEIRAIRARLLGFPNFAAFEIADQMARTPDRALALLSRLVPAAVARARDEAARLQARADQGGGGFALAPWDWPFFAEQVRREEFDVDADEVRQYLELDRVLQDGVFFAASQLFGLTFRERHDLPVYHPDVRVYEVIDHDGSPFAVYYLDPFSRPNKSGGAWMHSFVGQSLLLGTPSVVVNVLNLTKPAPGNPVLLAFDDVETLFHEFGHTLHEICSRVTYPTLAGTNVPRDWVEFPSQFNEHFALEPTVFNRYARHHRTGAPMPDALATRLRRLRTFNQGYATTEFLAAALLDHAWHTLGDDAAIADPAGFEREALARFGVDVPLIPPRYSTPYFLHIWGRGYAAAYYSYMWAEVIDQDAFRWLQQHGGLTRANGDLLRDVVLSRGNTEDGDVMFRRLCGRDPDIQPLLESRGLVT